MPTQSLSYLSSHKSCLIIRSPGTIHTRAVVGVVTSFLVACIPAIENRSILFNSPNLGCSYVFLPVVDCRLSSDLSFSPSVRQHDDRLPPSTPFPLPLSLLACVIVFLSFFSNVRRDRSSDQTGCVTRHPRLS